MNESTAAEALKQVRLWYVRPNRLVELRGLWHSRAPERPVETDFCCQAPERLIRSAASYDDLAIFGRDFRHGSSKLTRGRIEERRSQLRRRVANLAPGRFN